MTTQFDELSKSLATGMSRRKAARTFLAGLGGAAFAAFTGKTAFADTSSTCYNFCNSQAYQFMQMCLTASASCPEGMCASLLPAAPVITSTTTTTMNGTSINGRNIVKVPQYCVVMALSGISSPLPITAPVPVPAPVSGKG